MSSRATLTRSALGVVAATLVFLGVPMFDSGCGTTGGKRFDFDAAAGGAVRSSPDPLSFTNAKGWTITLTRATFTIGPIYLNVIEPLRGSTFLERFFVRTAAAHDDHLGTGREVGEVLARVTFDALSSELVPFPVRGSVVAEQVRTTEIWFWPPEGTSPEAIDVDASSVEVAGEATRGADRVRFRGALVLDGAWTSDAAPGERAAQPVTELRKLRGIPSSFFPTEGGRLEIRADVRALFAGADFANLATNPTDPDGTKLLVQSKTGAHTTDQVMRNVFQGLRASTGTYEVRWSERRSTGE